VKHAEGKLTAHDGRSGGSCCADVKATRARMTELVVVFIASARSDYFLRE
jgi:hypothetical protein